MARYAGRKGVVYAASSGAGTAIPVASLNSWNIDSSTDKIEVTAFGDANKTYVIGLKDLTGEFSGFWDHADTTIFAAADSADGTKLYLYPSSDAPTAYFYGPAWIDASMEVGVNDAITVSASFAANGSWGRKVI